MSAKYFLPMLLASFITNATPDTAVAPTSIEQDCTGKAAEKHPVVANAEQQAAGLTKALATCLAANNCQSCSQFRGAIQGANDVMVALDKHLNSLPQNTNSAHSCPTCQKNEVQNLQKNLATGLHVAQNVLSNPDVQNLLANPDVQNLLKNAFNHIIHK